MLLSGANTRIVAAPTSKPAITLDPELHHAGVAHFLKHFQLSTSPPSFEFLQKILGAFSHLPYENLSKILKFNRLGASERERLRLPEEIFEDHLRFHTGGTCFSLTFFLQSVLLQHGFTCYVIMGDMRAGRNIHCALVVLLEGAKYLVDPGYLLRQPMQLDLARPRLYHNEFNGVELRCEPTTQSYDLFTFTRESMKWRYRFADRPTPAEEFLRHWQASFHRNSMHGLCLTRVHEDELIYVRKDFMRINSMAGKRNVNLKKNYHATIHEVFGIPQEYVAQAVAALQENMARTRSAASNSEHTHTLQSGKEPYVRNDQIFRASQS